MNVSLTPELERRIAEKLETGLYTTASEVVREGLRLLFAGDESRERHVERLNEDIQLGLDQLDRGEGIAADEARSRLDAKMAGRRRAG